MNAKSIVVYNLIPFFLGKGKNIVRLTGDPETVAKKIRGSCALKAADYQTWAMQIEQHCPIPLSHPYRALIKDLPEGHPLRVLGAWAYGAGNSWITIEEIRWADGRAVKPQNGHRDWLKREAVKILG